MTREELSVDIAEIYFQESGTRLKPLYFEEDAARKWEIIKKLAKEYKYAEQAGFSAFTNWPNSEYFNPPLLDPRPGNPMNNSNVFARYLLVHSGIVPSPITEELMEGIHPPSLDWIPDDNPFADIYKPGNPHPGKRHKPW